ncbi:MAG: hypothetical protein HQL91_01885 [Magnetococcales bacterium]|nr:hypothetical protein [Magnetococcales bacterium]
MVAETMMFKLSGAAQAAQVPMLAGQSFTVGSTVATGDGMANWIFLHPLAGNGAGNGMVALKLEGARQAGQITSLVGKTVTVGKSPVGTAAAGKWLVLHQGVGGVAVKGAAGGGTLAMQQLNFEMEGASAAKGAATGKGALVCNGAKAGKGAAMAGKGMAAGKGSAALCKGGTMAAAGTGAAAGATAGAATGTTLGSGAMAGGVNTMAGGSALTGTATLAGGAKAAAGAKGIAAGGTIWTGSGTSLGLGLGLGAWGPILLVGAVAAVGVGIYSYMKRSQEDGELEDAIS